MYYIGCLIFAALKYMLHVHIYNVQLHLYTCSIYPTVTLQQVLLYFSVSFQSYKDESIRITALVFERKGLSI